jgi:hypothetical protein
MTELRKNFDDYYVGGGEGGGGSESEKSGRDPSTSQVLALSAQALAALRMTELGKEL